MRTPYGEEAQAAFFSNTHFINMSPDGFQNMALIFFGFSLGDWSYITRGCLLRKLKE